jgi:hypothetical protein
MERIRHAFDPPARAENAKKLRTIRAEQIVNRRRNDATFGAAIGPQPEREDDA